MRPQRHVTKNIKNRHVKPNMQPKRKLVIDKVENIENNTNLITTKLVKHVSKKNNKNKLEEEIPQKIENNEQNKEDMNNIDIKEIDALIQSDTQAPKRKVKVEKKEKGLFERTENSRIILTEDNKMLLND